jgi:tetratricopeptide (TPR) repeat protein
MRSYHFWKLGILSACLAGTGCQGLGMFAPKKEPEPQPLSVMGKGGLLIGPNSKETKAPQELEPKAASEACLAAASEMEKAGQIEEAIRLYEKARGDFPNLSSTIGRRLCILYDKAGDFTKATNEYEALLTANPNDADLLSDVGYSYYCRGDWANAEKHLRKATKVQASHKRAWLNLGLTLAAQARWQESYDTFLMAVAPGEAHCNLGFCMASQGMYEDAKNQYRKAVEIDPGLQMARVAITKLENMPPPGTVVQAAAKTPADPNKIPSVMEIMHRQKMQEASAKAKGDLESPIELDIPK